MPHEITVPRLGWSMEEATFVAWHQEDGARVEAGQPLFSLESEKATQEVEALDSGILHRLREGPAPGDIVRVGRCLGYLLAPGEAPPTAPAPGTPVQDASKSASATAVAGAEHTASATSRAAAAENLRASPRALRVAAQLGVALQNLRGTGRGGRIRERDVRAAASPRDGAGTSAASRRRRIIAERLVASLRSSAPVTLHRTVDATALVRWRARLDAAERPAGSSAPSYTALLAWITARTLPEHPLLNARWNGEAWESSTRVHLGIAVDTEEGLVVPVIRDAQLLGPEEISARLGDLATRARSGALGVGDSGEGTFTLTNLGALGVDSFTPILNPPESAILGVGRIARRPAVVDDRVVARDLIELSLTFDHRAMDGVPAARFLGRLAERIETADAG